MKNGGGTALLAAMIGGCTALTAAVHTGRTVDSPFSALLSQVQVGTALGVMVPPDTVVVPQGNSLLSVSQPVTAIGVAVHRHKGGGALGAATQTRLCLLFFIFFTTFANVLTLQLFHHHVQVC